ncbi:MAG: hypothetical protein QW212_03285 [Nitrososphaerales archaeon]
MIAHVALPKPIWHPFSYRVPENWKSYIFPLQRVLVPFRDKEKIGFVVGLEEGEGTELREIKEPVDFFPLIPDSIGRLIEWVRDSFLIPHGILLKYALSEFVNLEQYLILDSSEDPELNGISLKTAYKKYGKMRVISLVHSGELFLRDAFDGSVFPKGLIQIRGAHRAKEVLVAPLEKRLRSYFKKIDDVLELGGSCLFFVPPYQLSGGMFFKALKDRYGERVLWYGKEKSRRERVRTYLSLRKKTGLIVMSNILGLFLPISGLSLIIIERPEDENYTINSDFSIRIPECAIKRSDIEKLSIIIGTCSPTLSIFKEKESFDWKDEMDLYVEPRIVEGAGSRDRRSLFHLLSQVKNGLKESKKIALFFPVEKHSERIRCLSCNRVILCEECGFSAEATKDSKNLFCPRCERVISDKFECPYCNSTLLATEFPIFDQFKLLLEEEGIEPAIIRDPKNLYELQNLGSKNSRIILGQRVLSYAYGIKIDQLFLVNIDRLKNLWSYMAYEKLHQLIMNLLDCLRPESLILYRSKLSPDEVSYLLNAESLYKNELKKRSDLDLPPAKRLVLIKIRRRKGIAQVKERLNHYIKNLDLKNHIFGEKLENYRNSQVLKVLLKGISPKDLSNLFPLFGVPGLKIFIDPELI